MLRYRFMPTPLQGNHDWSFSALFKRSRSATANELLRKGAADVLQVGGDSEQVIFNVPLSDASTFTIQSANWAAQYDQIHLAVVTWDESTMTATLRVDDGDVVTGTAPLGGSAAEATWNMCRGDAGMDLFQGPSSLWSRVLTAEEQSLLWDDGRGPIPLVLGSGLPEGTTHLGNMLGFDHAEQRWLSIDPRMIYAIDASVFSGGLNTGDRLWVVLHEERGIYIPVTQPIGRVGASGQLYQPSYKAQVYLDSQTDVLDDVNETVVEWDRISYDPADILDLGTGTDAGEITVKATGRVRFYHHETAKRNSPTGTDVQRVIWTPQILPPGAVNWDNIKLAELDTVHVPIDGTDPAAADDYLSTDMGVGYGDKIRVTGLQVANAPAMTFKTVKTGSDMAPFLGLEFCGVPDLQNRMYELRDVNGAGELLPKLVGYWRLDEEDQANRADQSENEFHGIADADSGHNTKGLLAGTNVFDAAPQNETDLELGKNADNDIQDDQAKPESMIVSAAFWWRPIQWTASPTGTPILQVDSPGWEVQATANQTVFARVTNNDGDEVQTPGITLETGIWYFIVFRMHLGFFSLRVRSMAVGAGEDTGEPEFLDEVVTARHGDVEWDAWQDGPGYPQISGAFAAADGSRGRFAHLGIWKDVPLSPAQENFLYGGGWGRDLFSS
jgi:hypothetical protein